VFPALVLAAGFSSRVDRVLARTPLIDGHNDLPWEIRDRSKAASDATLDDKRAVALESGVGRPYG